MSRFINFLKTFFSYFVVSLSMRQCVHSFLASLWAIIPVRDVDSKYRSTSISSKRSIVERALLVWIVDRTKWPVIEARTAIWAVSESRISPISIIFGSWRKIDLKAAANVIPISAFTWTWFIPSMFISIGSSTVIMFISGRFNSCSIEYTVVDLPEPVAPVTKMIPFGTPIILLIFFKLVWLNPKCSTPFKLLV